MKGNITITKEDFIRIMDTLKSQNEYHLKVNELLNEIFEDGSGWPKDYKLQNELLDILKIAFNDISDEPLIEYYIYDLNYGKNWTPDAITENDGTIIDISTPEKLYDYLMLKDG